MTPRGGLRGCLRLFSEKCEFGTFDRSYFYNCFSSGVMKPYHFLSLATLLLASSVEGNWQEWWTYDGISGPGYWGVINPAWTLCTRGRHQSPINIDPGQLVRDLSLDEAPPFTVDKRPISGSLYNTGQALVFRVDSERAAHLPVNITGGPLAYR